MTDFECADIDIDRWTALGITTTSWLQVELYDAASKRPQFKGNLEKDWKEEPFLFCYFWPDLSTFHRHPSFGSLLFCSSYFIYIPRIFTLTTASRPLTTTELCLHAGAPCVRGGLFTLLPRVLLRRSQLHSRFRRHRMQEVEKRRISWTKRRLMSL